MARRSVIKTRPKIELTEAKYGAGRFSEARRSASRETKEGRQELAADLAVIVADSDLLIDALRGREG